MASVENPQDIKSVDVSAETINRRIAAETARKMVDYFVRVGLLPTAQKLLEPDSPSQDSQKKYAQPSDKTMVKLNHLLIRLDKMGNAYDWEKKQWKQGVDPKQKEDVWRLAVNAAAQAWKEANAHLDEIIANPQESEDAGQNKLKELHGKVSQFYIGDGKRDGRLNKVTSLDINDAICAYYDEPRRKYREEAERQQAALRKVAQEELQTHLDNALSKNWEEIYTISLLALAGRYPGLLQKMEIAKVIEKVNNPDDDSVRALRAVAESICDNCAEVSPKLSSSLSGLDEKGRLAITNFINQLLYTRLRGEAVSKLRDGTAAVVETEPDIVVPTTHPVTPKKPVDESLEIFKSIVDADTPALPAARSDNPLGGLIDINTAGSQRLETPLEGPQSPQGSYSKRAKRGKPSIFERLTPAELYHIGAGGLVVAATAAGVTHHFDEQRRMQDRQDSNAAITKGNENNAALAKTANERIAELQNENRAYRTKNIIDAKKLGEEPLHLQFIKNFPDKRYWADPKTKSTQTKNESRDSDQVDSKPTGTSGSGRGR